MAEPVRVQVGSCRCDGTPHADGDWVDFRPTLSVPMGTAAMAAISRAGDDASSVEAALAEVFILLGISAWSFPEPVTAEAIARLLPWGNGGLEVSSQAFDLYGEDFIAPLAPRRTKRSNGGLTADSTSVIRPSGSSRQKRSRPSSPVSTATSRSAVPAP